MDELESQGVISAQEGAKPRRILLEASKSSMLGTTKETLDDSREESIE
jgi:hypothetical protein